MTRPRHRSRSPSTKSKVPRFFLSQPRGIVFRLVHEPRKFLPATVKPWMDIGHFAYWRSERSHHPKVETRRNTKKSLFTERGRQKERKKTRGDALHNAEHACTSPGKKKKRCFANGLASSDQTCGVYRKRERPEAKNKSICIYDRGECGGISSGLSLRRDTLFRMLLRLWSGGWGEGGLIDDE